MRRGPVGYTVFGLTGPMTARLNCRMLERRGKIRPEISETQFGLVSNKAAPMPFNFSNTDSGRMQHRARSTEIYVP